MPSSELGQNHSAPGFLLDLMCNGVTFPEDGLRVDFAAPDYSVQSGIRLLKHGFDRGIVQVPTFVTSPPDVLLRNLSCTADALDDQGIEGRLIHCECPFFSGAEGARGAHPKEFCKGADIDFLRKMIEASRQKIALLTVGADVPGIPELIKEAVDSGIVVALGHHVPTTSQLNEAVDAGARWLTHHWNGLPQKIDRQGFVWDQLADRRLGMTIIPDGDHVRDPLVALAISLKGPFQIIAVSDRAPLGGAAPGTYQLWGSTVEVVEQPGRDFCRIQGTNGYLAGSGADLLQCMRIFCGWWKEWGESSSRPRVWSIDDDMIWRLGCLNALDLLDRQAGDFSHLPLSELVMEDGNLRLV
jgi:N-acetylglucosamine-6-phosphate deacetylase